MALSGSVTTTSAGTYNRSVTLNWTATQSIDKNQSTVSWSLVGSGGTSGWVQVSEIRIKIDGSQVFYRSSETHTNCYYGTELCSGKTVVDHAADGTKSISISVEAGILQYAINCSGSKSFTLDTIPRATTPTVSASSVDMGSSITISMPRASSSFTHTLTYSFGSASGTIGSGLGTSKSWTVPLNLANQVPNATSGTCTITCKTYSGSTLVGTKTVSFTAKVPSSVVPSISTITCTDPTGNLAKYGGYVQKKSTVKANVSAAGSYSSTIKTYSIVMNGSTYTSNGSTSSALSTSGTNTIKATVTDSRGRTATKSVTITVLAYVSPTISSFSVSRCDSDGTLNPDGAYMKAVFKTSITALNNVNSKSIVLKYKESSSSSWNTAATYSSYSVNTSKVISAGTDSTYNVMLTANDDFGSASITRDVGTVFTLIDFRSTGKGVAIGKVSESDKLEVNMDAEFLGNAILGSYNYGGKFIAEKSTSSSGEGNNGFFQKTPFDEKARTLAQIHVSGDYYLAAGGLSSGEEAHDVYIGTSSGAKDIKLRGTGNAQWNGNNLATEEYVDDSLNGFKIYTDCSQFGLSGTSNSLIDAFNKMPMKSMLFCCRNQGGIASAAADAKIPVNGVCRLVKYSGGRNFCEVTYSTDTGATQSSFVTYTGHIYTDNGTQKVEWHRASAFTYTIY